VLVVFLVIKRWRIVRIVLHLQVVSRVFLGIISIVLYVIYARLDLRFVELVWTRRACSAIQGTFWVEFLVFHAIYCSRDVRIVFLRFNVSTVWMDFILRECHVNDVLLWKGVLFVETRINVVDVRYNTFWAVMARVYLVKTLSIIVWNVLHLLCV